MRLCEFQTLLYEKLPETTDWPWIFNKFPNSISEFIDIDYTKLDRHIKFGNLNHLNQKIHHYIRQMKPDDSKLRENIMQIFYTTRTQQLSLEQLSDKLSMKWPVLLNKIINIFSLDFQVNVRSRPNQSQSDHDITITSPKNVTIRHPVFTTVQADAKKKPIEEGLISLGLKYKNKTIPIHAIQSTLHALTWKQNLLYTSNLMQSLQMMGIGRINLKYDTSDIRRRNQGKSQDEDMKLSFNVPTIAIKGWDTKLEQNIMNAFVSSLPVQNTLQAPYLPYITETSMNEYLVSQFMKSGTSQDKIFRTLTDTLWADLYTNHTP